MRYLPLALLLLSFGCRTFIVHYTHEDGDKKTTCYARDTVIGQGFTKSENKGTCSFTSETSETGFSDNAEPVLKSLTEGAAKGLSPGL